MSKSHNKRSKSGVKRSHKPVATEAKAKPAAIKPITAEKPAETIREPWRLTFIRRLGSSLKYGFSLIFLNIEVIRTTLSSTLLYLVIPPMVLILGSSIAGTDKTVSTHLVIGTFITLIALVWYALNSFCLYVFTLRAVRGDRPKTLDTYRMGLRFVPRLIGLGLLIVALAAVGAVFLIIPGLIVLRRYYLAPLFMVDEDLGIREAMDKSAAHTKPFSPAMFGIFIILGCFILISYLCGRLFPPYGSLLGILIASLYVYTPALVYQQLYDSSLDSREELKRP